MEREIHVRLLDEPVDVWRPVRAVHLRDDVYRIAPQAYDADIERWQFIPGDVVVCALIELEGAPTLVATEQVDTEGKLLRLPGHVYAIVRVDSDQSSTTPWETRVTVTKVVPDLATAQSEVQRLTKINGNKGCTYFWQATRLVKRVPKEFLE